MLINCHTQYSLKYGILSLEEVFIEIKKGGHDIFAVTDINNTSACMYALKEASNYGLQAAVGVDFRNGIRQQYVCVAKSCAGLKEINDHLSFHLINSLPFNSKAPSFENVFVNVELDTQKDAWSIAAGNYSSRFAGAVAGTTSLAAKKLKLRI